MARLVYADNACREVGGQIVDYACGGLDDFFELHRHGAGRLSSADHVQVAAAQIVCVAADVDAVPVKTHVIGHEVFRHDPCDPGNQDVECVLPEGRRGKFFVVLDHLRNHSCPKKLEFDPP
jgi:hypothetical protein